MKIAFLNDVAYEYAVGSTNALGGSERNIWFHSRALAAAGWSVIIGVRAVLREGERRVIDGVEYVGIGRSQILMAWYRFLSSERPDWLYWAGASHLLGPLVEIAKLAGVRTVFHAAFDAHVQPRRALVRRSRWWLLYAWGLWRAERIFVQHSGQLSMLHPRLLPKARILPKVCRLPPAMQPHSQRQEYVAWVATLREHKRPDVLIDIARRAPDVRFIVCGGPTDYCTPPGYGMRIVETLTKLPNVDYRGRVSSDEAMKVITNAALLLCTSDEEGFPNTFTQAWSSGTPIVTLKVDPDSIIEKRGLGTVSGTIDVAVGDISALLASVDRREEIATLARRYILEHHNEAVVVGIFTDALSILGGNDAPSDQLGQAGRIRRSMRSVPTELEQ
jgi:glycosyltransferase involved in cell wall biosynthesis